MPLYPLSFQLHLKAMFPSSLLPASRRCSPSSILLETLSIRIWRFCSILLWISLFRSTATSSRSKTSSAPDRHSAASWYLKLLMSSSTLLSSLSKAVRIFATLSLLTDVSLSSPRYEVLASFYTGRTYLEMHKLTECSILDHFILSALAAIEPEESNGGRGAKFTSD
jgi:hypothetical protein